MKYEQTVEGDNTRFSKPHITLLSIISLIQLKNCLRHGVIMLDVEANSFNEIAGISFLVIGILTRLVYFTYHQTKLIVTFLYQ